MSYVEMGRTLKRLVRRTTVSLRSASDHRRISRVRVHADVLFFPHSTLPVSHDLRPAIAPPPPLRGADPDSFAYTSIVDRLPKILRRVLDDNVFPPGITEGLQQLHSEIPATPLHPIDDPGAPDAEAWREYVDGVDGADWLEVPWFFAETYFYRRIVAETGFFTGPLKRFDPFVTQKKASLYTSRSAIRPLAAAVTELLRHRPPTPGHLSRMLALCLWGNRADLSLWAADDDNRGSLNLPDDRILADDRPRVVESLLSLAPNAHVQVVADNAGFELVGDLALVDALLSGEVADTVHLHLKSHPTFVSDALHNDVADTIGFLRDSVNRHAHELGARLQQHVSDDRLTMNDDLYWTSPLPGWEMPERVATRLAESDLVLFKGDANYRRLLGDRHWDPDTPFDDAAGYLPIPIVTLRTLKAEVQAGLSPEAIERAAATDPDWKVDGEWGVIQMA